MAQIRLAQVGAGQVHLAQVLIAQVGALEVGAGALAVFGDGTAVDDQRRVVAILGVGHGQAEQE